MCKVPLSIYRTNSHAPQVRVELCQLRNVISNLQKCYHESWSCETPCKSDHLPAHKKSKIIEKKKNIVVNLNDVSQITLTEKVLFKIIHSRYEHGSSVHLVFLHIVTSPFLPCFLYIYCIFPQ